MKTRFSVLVPVYNRETLVGPTIDSVLAQTFTDYELIVVDDGSTDRTSDVLRSYGARIKVICQANQGPEVARGRAAAIATGKYFAMLDSDDLLMPCALATYDRIIRAFDAPPLIIGAMTYFKHGEPVPQESDSEQMVEVLKYRDFLSRDVSLGMSSSRVVVRRSDFEAAGGLRSAPTAFPLDTLDIVLRVGTCGPCVIVRRPITVAYRYHETNVVRNLERMVKSHSTLIRLERRREYPGGRARFFGRYACIGGSAAYWVKRALQGGRPGLGFRLFLISSPMIAAVLAKKLWCWLRGATTPIHLPKGNDEQSNG